MKILLNFILLAALPAAAQSDLVGEFTLDEFSVITVPLVRNRVTIVSFPSPIESLHAVNVSVDPKVPSGFNLSYEPGKAFFTLIAQAAGATANVNVMWKKKPYVLLLVETNAPLLSVLLREPVAPEMALSARQKPTPLRLVGLLETARAYPLLRTQHAEAVRGVQNARPGQVSDLGDCDITLEEAFRFEQEDALVFRLLIKNKTRQEFRYDPASFSLRVGGRVFPQAISDASGTVPPLAEASAYFAVAGAPGGGRNELSLKNEFHINLRALSTTNAAPSSPR